MKRQIFTTLFLISIVLQSNAQDLLKEISKTFDNGQPMIIDYLETDNLKKIKTELFNEQGKMIFSMQFNPDSGLPDGEFYDLINKGSFSNGVLNCKSCMLVEANKPSVYTYNYNKQNTLITKGDVINGRLIGEVKRYVIAEDTYRKVDWESTRKYVAAGANIGFRDVKTYRTGNFKETLVDTKNYNENGVLDGEIFVGNKNGWHARLNVDNGIVRSYVSYDKNGIVIDSLFNENKIWKINYKFEKNSGFLVFKSPKDFRPPRQWDERDNDYNHFISPLYRDKRLEKFYNSRLRDSRYDGTEFKDKFKMTLTNGVIPIGGIQNYEWEEFGGVEIYQNVKKINSGGKPLGLDNNGLYSIHLEGMFDNIIRYDLKKHPKYVNNKTFLNFSRGTRRDSNLFVLVYNYLKNNKEHLKYRMKHTDIPNASSIIDFVSSLMSPHYLKDDASSALRKNAFSKYLKKSLDKYVTKDKNGSLEIKEYSWNRYESTFYITINDFFKDFISLTDYLKACKESISKEYTEIQEIWVWNKSIGNYDKVNFEELIQLAEEKEKEEAKVATESYEKEKGIEYIKVKNIYNDYLKAIGGRDYVEAINTIITSGTLEYGGMEMNFENKKTKDGKQKVVVSLNGNPISVQVYNGESGYVVQQGQRMDMTEDQIKSMEANGGTIPELNVPENAKFIGVKRINGEETNAIEATDNTTDYYSLNSGLKIVTKTLDKTGQTTETTYKYYKEVNSVLMPHTLILKSGLNEFKYKINDIIINRNLSDSNFD